MVSIIKNQLLKHLSRYTKNLSADKINLSTFKGEGELSNLELDEIVLTDLLELPCWLRLTRAWCNKVTFRIPWTKLRSVPIYLNLDEVYITLETCEELRVPSTSVTYNGGVPSKYSFIHKVIDGITISVNAVNIVFNSPAFTASVQISRILVESKTPKFTRSDLRMTRLKNQEKGQLLIFKELEWQTVRIEAKSTVDNDLTPLRLLTNQARCRIVMKKRISDCFIVGCRLAIILDDLLWVLTDTQLKALLHFLESLADLVEKSTQVTRSAKAARKLEELPEYQAQIAQEVHGIDVTDESTLFAAYDVIETSYHFLSNQVVLHLCDDPGSGRSSYPNLKDGGALQICIRKIQFDYYPYHLAKGNRKHWPNYNTSAVPHTVWQEQALNCFRAKLMDLIDENNIQHNPLRRSTKESANTSNEDSKPNQTDRQKENKIKMNVQLSKLMSSCAILRIDDFTVYKVTTSCNKQGLKEFIYGDRSHITLPKDSNNFHAEFIYYYYPSNILFPLPPPKFHVQLNPVSIIFDIQSCLWLNSFGLNLFRSLADTKNEVKFSDYTYVDVKIEAILPKVTFESTSEQFMQKNRPKFLSVQVTRAVITNVRGFDKSSRADLAKCIDSIHMGSLFFGSEFPSNSGDFYVVTQKFLDHISTYDNIRTLPLETDVSPSELMSNCELLWTEARDVWCINLDPIWGNFHDPRSPSMSKSVIFLNALPVTIWLHADMDPNSTRKTVHPEKPISSNADIHVLVHISNLISIQIDHFQYLFLMRLAEEAALLTTFMSMDAEKIFEVERDSTIVMGALIPQVEINFVMPYPYPERDSTEDVESFIHDSSSITDSTFSVWHNSLSAETLLETSKKLSSNGSAHHVERRNNIGIDHTNQRRYVQQQSCGNVNIQTNLNIGLTSVKKGFTSMMSSIDSALKPSPDDMSDTVSKRSDASSDSEQFVNLRCEPDIPGKDLMFIVPEFFYEESQVEEASEVLEEEEEASACDTPGNASIEKINLIMVSTFKLNEVEFVYQSMGYSSSLKIQIGGLSSDDGSTIPWEEFQMKFNMISRTCIGKPFDVSTMSKVRLRLDHNLAVSIFNKMDLNLCDRDHFSKVFKDKLIIRAYDVLLNLNMSTLTGLVELTQDELPPTMLLLEVNAENVQLLVNEDRPSKNTASFERVPLNLNITKIYIIRNEDGVFNILPTFPAMLTTSKEPEFNQGSSELKNQLSLDNEELKRRLSAFDRVLEENRALQKIKEEADILRSCLEKSQDQIALLMSDKTKLLNEMSQLQEQMSSGSSWVFKNSKI